MPKQEFELVDYFGPVVVAVIFALVLLFLSFFFINFFCITKHDDLTHFEKAGAKFNVRLGPHSLHVIKKGGFPSSDPDEEALVK